LKRYGLLELKSKEKMLGERNALGFIHLLTGTYDHYYRRFYVMPCLRACQAKNGLEKQAAQVL
jgi:hypothetical protein